MTTPAPVAKEEQSLGPLLPMIAFVLLGTTLAAWSPRSTGPALEGSSSPAPSRQPGPASEIMVLGTVDDPAALNVFLGEMQHPPKAVVARTVDGGGAHPRITLVYLADVDGCGSGGCRLLVLEPRNGGLKEMSVTTLSRPPVRVLDTRTSGMPDLAVTVCGGGIVECHEALLPFDGQGYASNPTMPPARALAARPSGTVAISAEEVFAAFRR